MSNFVLAITGPTGAGKSTVSQQLSKHLERCVIIDADAVKHMIVSGFYVDAANPEDPSGWGFSEWELVCESIGLLAQNFQKHGYDVIINGYIDEPAWHTMLQYIATDYKVLLLPKLDTIIQRDAGRSSDVQMGEAIARRHHHYFDNDSFFNTFTRLDSTHESIDETVTRILTIIRK